MSLQQDELGLDFSPPPTRHFLGWEQPLLTLAVDYLAKGWQQGPLDLSDTTLLVPTRNASRRLREALARKAAERNTGSLPPQIANPDDFLTEASPASPLATRLDLLLAWVEVLQQTRLEDYPHLFPVDPGERGLSWALKTARDFTKVQSLLGEAARTAGSVSRQFEGTDYEPERWAEFAQLEDETYRLLRSQGKLPRALSRQEAVESFQLPPECKRLIVIGVVDPPPALEKVLTRLAGQVPTEILINAPASLADLFDALGRPTEDWTERPLHVPAAQIHPTAHPEAQGRFVHQRMSLHPQPEAVVSLGVPDTEVIAPLRKSLADAGIQTFDPAGTPLANQGFCHFLRTFQEVLATRSYHSFRELLRSPGVAEAAGRHEIPEGGQAFSSARVLIQFDRFHEMHLPLTIDDAFPLLEHLASGLDKAVLTRGLRWIRSWLNQVERSPLAEGLTSFLTEVYEQAFRRPDEDFTAVVDLLHKVLDDFIHPALPQLALDEQLQLFLSLLEEQTLTAKRPPRAIDLPGWLELPWEDAPHLLITGFNDGLVPETIQAHPWLPDHARRALGLRHNATRHARDAYLLAALMASRKEGGHLDLIFGRTNASGDPLRPSRLLLALPEDELAERVEFLFREDPPSQMSVPQTVGWQLTPPAPTDNILERLSVTSFSAYLACPFRFYLSHVLKMREPQVDLMEMNAPAFGEFAHQVLEDFAKTPAAKSSEPAQITECFHDLLTDNLQRRFGSNRALPLLIQEESLRQRLAWWARIEASQRNEGWSILEAETSLSGNDSPFTIDGMRITGRIDRIEQHPDEGIRILDFKTSQKPVEPDTAHLVGSRSLDDYPDWRIAALARPKLWSNLQLPLYLLAMEKRYPEQRLTTGYINLPPTQKETGLKLWDELDEELLASAEDCVRGVIAQIKKQVFWPPAEKPRYDDYRSILLGNPEEAVDPVNLTPSPTQP